MNRNRIFAHAGAVLAVAAILGCSDSHSSDKAELATLYSQLATSTATNAALSSAIATDSTKLAYGAQYRSCMTTATTTEQRTVCNEIPY